MKHLLSKIDKAVMVGFDWATSTKGALYLLIILILIANILQPPSNVSGLMIILISEFYQGCALPSLGVSQKMEAEKTRQLLQETHDIVFQELSEIKLTHQSNVELLAEMKEILELLKEKH